MTRMNYGFNRNQLDRDLEDFLKFFTGFSKSYGPSAKKVSGKEIGFFEEMYIRFRLWLVELGISQLIRLGIVIVVGLILWVTIFRNAMLDVRILTLFGFIVFTGWMMDAHLSDKGEPIHMTARVVLETRDFGFKLFEGIKQLVTDIFYTLFPNLAEKKK